jgi:hypothetical protein
MPVKETGAVVDPSYSESALMPVKETGSVVDPSYSR